MEHGFSRISPATTNKPFARLRGETEPELTAKTRRAQRFAKNSLKRQEFLEPYYGYHGFSRARLKTLGGKAFLPGLHEAAFDQEEVDRLVREVGAREQDSCPDVDACENGC